MSGSKNNRKNSANRHRVRSGRSDRHKTSGQRRTRNQTDSRHAAASGTPTRLILFNKPFDVLCQFTDRSAHSQTGSTETKRQTLADYIDEPGIYPAGRLDRDSEGLLLLTNNGRLQSRISHPVHKLPKTYLVQVEGELTISVVQKLQSGIDLKDGPARAIEAAAIEPPAWIWPRHPPVRFRKTVPDSWLTLTIDEGRNRQVRRMTAAVGHPTLRLVRTSIGPWFLDELAPGEWQAGDPLAIEPR